MFEGLENLSEEIVRAVEIMVKRSALERKSLCVVTGVVLLMPAFCGRNGRQIQKGTGCLACNRHDN
jgi:hypothetical protein